MLLKEQLLDPVKGETIVLSSYIQLYEDPELIRLRFEVATLERELARWESRKAGLEQQIHKLGVCYRKELGALLSQLAQLRQDQFMPNPDRQAQPEDDNEEELAEPLQPEQPPALTPAEQKELKDLFRKACKRCHPDVAVGEFEEKAQVIFIELKLAYERNDLERVRAVWQRLTQGGLLDDYRLPASHDLARLQAARQYLRARIQVVRVEVDKLKRSAAYRRLAIIDDWDEYFDDLKAKLRRQINRLKRGKQARAA
jgi:hypothetical protein